jgi:hypothetical protein
LAVFAGFTGLAVFALAAFAAGAAAMAGAAMIPSAAKEAMRLRFMCILRWIELRLEP